MDLRGVRQVLVRVYRFCFANFGLKLAALALAVLAYLYYVDHLFGDFGAEPPATTTCPPVSCP